MERTTISINNDQALELFSSDSYLTVNKRLLSHYGLEVAVFLCNLVDKYLYFKYKRLLEKDNWFFLTHAQQTEQTGLTESKLRKCKNTLKRDKVIQTRMGGVPAKEKYLLNISVLLAILNRARPKEKLGLDPPESVGLIKEPINKEKEKKLNKKSSINLFNQYFSKEWKDDESFQKVLTEFITHRNQIRKPVTELAAKKLANKLTKYSCWVARTALQASVENSWTGVFPESVKSTDEDSTELPPQEIIQHYFKGKKDSMYADTFYEGTVCDAEDLLMDRTNGQCSQLARNVVALYDWIACTQTEEAREHRDIPSPGLLIGNYVMWLERQTGWLSIEPRLFTHDNSIFRRKFLPKESNEIGFDVITGKYFK